MGNFKLEIRISTVKDYETEAERNKAGADLETALDALGIEEGHFVECDDVEAFDSAQASLGTKVEQLKRVKRYEPEVI